MNPQLLAEHIAPVWNSVLNGDFQENMWLKSMKEFWIYMQNILSSECGWQWVHGIKSFHIKVFKGRLKFIHPRLRVSAQKDILLYSLSNHDASRNLPVEPKLLSQIPTDSSRKRMAEMTI